jgi:hypothetical protein
MVVIDRQYTGGAVQTSSGTAFTPVSPGPGGTFTVADATGYPPSGKFVVKLNRGLSDEEKILVDSRAGTTFTVGTRGYDGTTAQNHTSPSVELVFDAVALQQLVDHVDDVETDPHSTKLLNNARHDITARHAFGAALGTPATPPAVVANAAGTAGVGSVPSRSDHGHAGPVTGTPVGVGTANAAGSGTALALANHVHELNAGSVDSNTFFAAGVVNAAALASNAVETAKIADANVTLAKFASEAWTNFTPTFPNVTLGSGGTSFGRRIKLGRVVVFFCGFTLGTGGNVTAAITIESPTGTPAETGGMAGFAGARATDTSTGALWGAIGQMNDTFGFFNFGGAGTQGWGATAPFDWNVGDSFFAGGFYETTA